MRVLALSLICIGSAIAAEVTQKDFDAFGLHWVQYSVGKYYAPQSVRLSRSGFVRVWEIGNFDKPMAGALSVKMLTELDCKDLGVRTIQTTYFSDPGGVGEVIPFSDPDQKWFYPPPATTGERLIKLVCDVQTN